MGVALDVANVGQFAQDSAGTSASLTTGATVAAGATILVAGSIAASSFQTISSIVDDGPKLAWTIDQQFRDTGASQALIYIASARAPAGMASGTTITANFSASVPGGRSIVASSFLGVAMKKWIDALDSSSLASGAGWTTNNVPIRPGSLIFAIAADWTALDTSTPTAPSLETHDLGDGAGFAVTTCYRIEAATGVYPVAGTWSQSGRQGPIQAVAYRAATSQFPLSKLPKKLMLGRPF